MEGRSGTTDLQPRWRFPLLAIGIISLVVGTLAGLLRLGWAQAAVAAPYTGSHGVLMVAAFFGTLISLERAVALADWRAYLVPGAAALGGVTLLLQGSPAVIQTLFILAGAGLTLTSVEVYRRQPERHNIILVLGAASWLAASLALLLGASIDSILFWWMDFFVLTIAGERLELNRMRPASDRAISLFSLIVIITVISHIATTSGLVAQWIGYLGYGAIALWLLTWDIARHTARQQGLTRFMALCMLSGYLWLLLSALLCTGVITTPFLRDAQLHALFLGFVFSMVFGHAPIIFPAVTRLRIPYTPLFYIPLILLQVTLALRLYGDFTASPSWRTLGGVGNGLALALFLLLTVTTIIRFNLPRR